MVSSLSLLFDSVLATISHTFTGFLSTLSSEASVFTLTTITLDRYFSIVHPLTLKERNLRIPVGVMSITWTLAALLALLPLLGIQYYGDNFYGSNGMCLPLHIHDPYAKVNCSECNNYDPYTKAWEHSAIIFIGFNLVAFMFIAYAYGRMILAIRESQMSLRSTQEKQDRILVKSSQPHPLHSGYQDLQATASVTGVTANVTVSATGVTANVTASVTGVTANVTVSATGVTANVTVSATGVTANVTVSATGVTANVTVVKMVFHMSRWPVSPPRTGTDSNPSNSYVMIYRGRFQTAQMSTRTTSTWLQKTRGGQSLEHRGIYGAAHTNHPPCTCPPTCDI
ncbi:G-protein coupled receptor GRL101-like 1 [Homarus americanus]|uniref:G-protein coupled receptor GRL101-like 1 n=1 Tax=Homarus americanus TaxID=6706 RepID=A0A8J5NAV5_HOMAM|nr:G-protein coupled receptor GRL101-like 1 [Homarus americanus]